MTLLAFTDIQNLYQYDIIGIHRHSKSVSYDHFSVETSYVPIWHYWHLQTFKSVPIHYWHSQTQNLYIMITSVSELTMYQYDVIGWAANIMWVKNDRPGTIPSNCTNQSVIMNGFIASVLWSWLLSTEVWMTILFTFSVMMYTVP